MQNKETKFRFLLSLILGFVGILLVNYFHQLNHTDVIKNLQEPITPIFVIPGLPFPVLLLFGLGFGVLGWIITSRQFSQKFVGEATAESLGAIRIITCTTAFITTIWLENISTSALLPQEMRRPMGVIDLFYNIPGFETFVVNQTSLQIFEWLTALVLFLGIIGLQTRFFVPLGAFCYLLLGGILRHKIYFFHPGLTVTYVLILVAFTPCGDGLSVDRLWKVHKGESVPRSDLPLPIYGWSRYFCWTALGLAYFFAGLSKIRDGGLFWFDATNMMGMLYKSALDPMGFNFDISLYLIDAPDIIFIIMGLMGSYAEIAFISVLFSRLSRKIMPIIMMSMHIGILIFQNILFFDSICIQLIFFDFTKIKQSIGKWLRFNNIQENSNLSASENTALMSASTIHFRTFKYSLMVCILTTIMLFSWLYRIEMYPLTSWQMFAGKNTSGIIKYSKVLATYESGITESINIEKVIPVLFSSKSRSLLRQCFSKNIDKLRVCEILFESAGNFYNSKPQNTNKITKFEIQQWKWNFISEPYDSNYGEMIKNHILSLK
ncbi:MAG: hypothetical protein WBA93_35730 [Microcoleaceae cyanobacterium]